ncbi:MAG: EutN/CcmL family microcompartment protein [Bdellovibrionota bacterium]
MQYAIVKGTVVATRKVQDLLGVTLKVLLPCDEKRSPVGEAFVACDALGSRTGDFVLWVGKREASMAMPHAGLINNYPVDAAVTGIIDDIS